MTSLHEASSGSSGGSPEKTAAPDDDASIDAPEGFDEIENAFARVSLVADALLDSIQDDDLRGEERKRERRRRQNSSNSPMASRSRTPTNYVTDSDDDGNNHPMMGKEDDEDHQVNLHTQSYHLQQQQQQEEQDDHHYGYHHNNNNYGGDESDISTLGDMTFGEEDESMDGSLINDVANLKSVTRAMRAEMQKQEEAFHANVTHSSPQTFFQKLEKDDEAKTTPRIKNHSLAVNNNRPTTIISVRNNKTANGGQQVPVLISTRPMKRRSSVMKQLQRLCHQYLGSKPKLPLLVANLLVWVCFFKLVWSSKDNLLDKEGRLRVAFAS